MGKQLAALLIAVALPGTASAWSWGTAPDASVDVFHVPKVSDTYVVTDTGDGFGLRGTFRAYQMVSVLVEHSRLKMDSGIDYNQSRLGAGVALQSGTGLYLEYADDDYDGTGYTGYGVRGRVMGMARDDVRLFADVGQIKYKESGDEYDELFYSVGGNFSVTPMFGIFADYKRSSYDYPDDPTTETISQVRLGMNIAFGF